MDEPDIIGVISKEEKRQPNIFVEIKNTSDKDRWIGLTEEQFNTIKRGANGQKIYMIYASVQSEIVDDNPKTGDLIGIFLKEIENKKISEIFQKFADLNAKCKIEFIISSEDLETYSFPFEKGMNMYETELFSEKNSNTIYNGLGEKRKDILKIDKFINHNSIIELKLLKDISAERKEISEFKIEGSFSIAHKKASKIIECLTDVNLENDVFGAFQLKKNKFYDFNLRTIGRDPKLKRNNLFIAKNRIYQLIDKNKIRNPEKVIREIAKEI